MLLGSTIAELQVATGPHCRNGLKNLAQVAYRAVLSDGRQVLALYTPAIAWRGGLSHGPGGQCGRCRPDLRRDRQVLAVGSTGGGTATLNLTGGQAHIDGDLTNSPGAQILVPPAANVPMRGPVVNEGVLDVGAGAVVRLAGPQCVGAPGGCRRGECRRFL